MSRKDKKICATLNYFEHVVILASVITGCISMSAFPIRITSSVIGLITWAIATGTKRYMSKMRKRKRIMIK